MQLQKVSANLFYIKKHTYKNILTCYYNLTIFIIYFKFFIIITGTTHQDLLIRNNIGENMKNERKRRKKRKELVLKSKSNAINLEAGGNDGNIRLKSLSDLKQSNRRASSSDLTSCNGTTTHDFIKTALSVRNKRMSGPLQHSMSLIESNKNKIGPENKSKSLKTFLKKILN